MADEKSLSVMDVSKLLHVSKNTVYAMVNRGELNSYRIGRKVRFTQEDINDYIAKARHEVQTAPVHRVHVESTLLNQEEDDTEEFIISGQDVILDILSNLMNNQKMSASRAFLGSFESILSLYQDKVKVATSHLWDYRNDDYNTEYVRWLMPGHDAVIINLTYRWQGFYVKAGNPKQIRDWMDLTREDVRYLNRRKGSGSRILLDGKIKALGILPDQINGYEEEIGSHLSLASAIAKGEADVGIGTERVTYAMKEIEFIPLQRERYDMIIKKQDLQHPKVKKMLEILNSLEYRCEVAGISGNDYSDTGKIMAVI